MSETVTVANLMIMTLIVSEEALARDRHTDRHAHRQRLGLGYLPYFTNKIIDKNNHKFKKKYYTNA